LNDSAVEMLQNSPLWTGLTKQDLGLVVKSWRERSFEPGRNIVSEGEAGDSFYLILEGLVEVRSGGKLLSRLGPGQFFGEMAILENQPRSADVIAVEASRLLVLSAPAFKTLIFANPKIALKMLHEFARRIRNTDRGLSD